MLRIRRACYDKPHRCPGWAGGGFRYAKKSVCDGGSIPYSESKFDQLMVKRCATCGTIRLPITAKWVDPRWLKFVIGSRISDLRYERQRERLYRSDN